MSPPVNNILSEASPYYDNARVFFIVFASVFSFFCFFFHLYCDLLLRKLGMNPCRLFLCYSLFVLHCSSFFFIASSYTLKSLSLCSRPHESASLYDSEKEGSADANLTPVAMFVHVLHPPSPKTFPFLPSSSQPLSPPL